MIYRNIKSVRFALTVLILLLLSTAHFVTANTSVVLNGSKVVIESNVIDSCLRGETPGSITIVYAEKDSIPFTAFSSCGCSEYYITQSSRGIQIDVYSDISVIWESDCCIEDQLPFTINDADIKFSFYYCDNGLSGRVEIISNISKYDSISIQDMDYVATHPDEYFGDIDLPNYRQLLYIITYYRSLGCSNTELYDFIRDFEREMTRKNILTERDYELRQTAFRQICDLFKFALHNENTNLGIDKLKELGQLTGDIINYYDIMGSPCNTN